MIVVRIERALHRKRIYNVSKSDMDIIARLLIKMASYKNNWNNSSQHDKYNNIDKGYIGSTENFANLAINSYANFPSFLVKIKRDYGLDRKSLVSLLVESFDY